MWVKAHECLPSPEHEGDPGRPERAGVRLPAQLLARERGLVLGPESGCQLSCAPGAPGAPGHTKGCVLTEGSCLSLPAAASCSWHLISAPAFHFPLM